MGSREDKKLNYYVQLINRIEEAQVLRRQKGGIDTRRNADEETSKQPTSSPQGRPRRRTEDSIEETLSSPRGGRHRSRSRTLEEPEPERISRRRLASSSSEAEAEAEAEQEKEDRSRSSSPASNSDREAGRPSGRPKGRGRMLRGAAAAVRDRVEAQGRMNSPPITRPRAAQTPPPPPPPAVQPAAPPIAPVKRLPPSSAKVARALPAAADAHAAATKAVEMRGAARPPPGQRVILPPMHNLSMHAPQAQPLPAKEAPQMMHQQQQQSRPAQLPKTPQASPPMLTPQLQPKPIQVPHGMQQMMMAPPQMAPPPHPTMHQHQAGMPGLDLSGSNDPAALGLGPPDSALGALGALRLEMRCRYAEIYHKIARLLEVHEAQLRFLPVVGNSISSDDNGNAKSEEIQLEEAERLFLRRARDQMMFAWQLRGEVEASQSFEKFKSAYLNRARDFKF